MSWELIAISLGTLVLILSLVHFIFSGKKKKKIVANKPINRKRVVEENFYIATFVAELAIKISKAENRTLCGRHFTEARLFYMDHVYRLGISPREFHGLFRAAKSHAQKCLDETSED